MEKKLAEVETAKELVEKELVEVKQSFMAFMNQHPSAPNKKPQIATQQQTRPQASFTVPTMAPP